jgi:hypothetical protein
MSGEDQPRSFWTGANGIVTAVAALLTAGAGLLVALFQVGVMGDDRSSAAPPAAEVTAAPSSTPPTTSPPASTPPASASASPVADLDGPGATLAGAWSGIATNSEGGFDVELTIDPSCALRKPCGSMYVSSVPCTGRVRLWRVKSTTYEFYVDRFSGDSSPDCNAGAGEFFERVDDGHLRYTTDYSDAVGLLQRK